MSGASHFEVPSGDTCIRVRVMALSFVCGLPTSHLMGPDVKGMEQMGDLPAFSILLEHPSGRKLLYDLGIRKDWENLAPMIKQRLERGSYKIKLDEKDPLDAIETQGIKGRDIEAVIWSHWHWDHTGQMDRFPPSTDLIVGPNIKSAPGFDGKTPLFPGYPAGPDSCILESDYNGRSLRVLEFDSGLKLGRFPAFDYFGDGSLYILDSPGHAVGHLCALVRTTAGAESGTFVFLGGDAAHSVGQIRPSAKFPFPSVSTKDIADTRKVFRELQESRGRGVDDTLFTPKWGADLEQAIETQKKMQDPDADANVFMLIAHDAAALDIIDLFPKEINDWKAKGWRQKAHWAFLKRLDAFGEDVYRCVC